MKAKLADEDVLAQDITKIDVKEYISSKTAKDDVILICGGDGTLNRFVNDIDIDKLERRIDFYTAGTGNDFFRDLGLKSGDIAENINIYLCNLPRVTVKGKTTDYKKVWHGSGKLKTLSIFPGIFKGDHLMHIECCKVFTGKNIHVKFDRPCALQIDGETIPDVEEYTVEA